MSFSRQEEIISALWAIASLIAFSSGYNLFGWIFCIKAATDTFCSVYYALSEISKDKK